MKEGLKDILDYIKDEWEFILFIFLIDFIDCIIIGTVFIVLFITFFK